MTWRRHAAPRVLADRSDVQGALAALDAAALRAFVTETLDGLEPAVRGPIEDALLRRAAARADFRPAAPPCAIVDEVVAFVAAARRIARAAPSQVDLYLRQAVAASLAGEHATARAIFEAIFVPLCEAEIDLGQDELVEEVLSVDLHDCVARYLVAIYLDTSKEQRAEAIFVATERVDGLGTSVEPLRDMERAHGRALPEMDAFLDAWIAHLETSTKPGGEWESNHDRWLRDAVARRDGTAGLARIARNTRRPQALREWCDALVRDGDWKAALDAFEEAAKLVPAAHWVGDFLDGAALAAHRIGRRDVSQKLEAAWIAAPSLARLLRWLVADGPSAKAADATLVRKRAATVLASPPTRAASMLAFLHLLGGEPAVAARLLGSAAGLGWSNAEHPGHLLFASFVWLLGDPRAGSQGATLLEALRAPPRSLLETDDDSSRSPRALRASTVLEVLEGANARARIAPGDRAAMVEALKKAAAARADGVTDEKRRRHYDHAAVLVACCAEIEGPAGRPWLDALRARTARFPAFQDALRRRLAGSGAAARSIR